MLVVFSLFFAADTRIIIRHDFVVPLNLNSKGTQILTRRKKKKQHILKKNWNAANPKKTLENMKTIRFVIKNVIFYWYLSWSERFNIWPFRNISIIEKTNIQILQMISSKSSSGK